MRAPIKRLKEILGYLHHPNKNNLLKKYMLYFFVIILIPVAIIFSISVLYTISFQNYQTSVVAIKTVTTAENIITTSLDYVENQSYSVLSSSQIKAAIFSNDVPGDAQAFKDAKEIMMSTLEFNNSLHSVSVYSFYNDYLFGTNSGNYLSDINKNTLPWYTYYEETGHTDFFISVSSNGTEYLCLVRSLKTNGNLSAFSIFYIDADLLFSFANQENYILVSNTDKKSLYSTSMEDPENSFSKYIEKLSPDTNIKEISFNTVVASTNLPFTNLSIIMFMDNPAKNHIPFIITIFSLWLVLLLILSLYLSGYLTDKFYSHIAKTISYLTSNTETSYDNTQDELSWIQNNIYAIIDSNKNLEFELSKNIIHLKNLQIVAMQLQCNPHFLFNALNLANMHLLTSSDTENIASEIIVLVSDMLRTALDTEHYFTTIEDELLFAQKYIKLQSLKYGNNFDTEYNVDKSILQNKTVKLTMQPLLENSFKHGICKLPPSIKGKIEFLVFQEENNIIIRITDNGIADEKELKLVNDYLNHDLYTITKKNIGLKNTNARIKILFGTQYGCKIYRENNKTVAEMIIPKKI